jgi:hypothetical protein
MTIPQIGAVVHGYRLEAEIGRGETSVVHRARGC